MPGPENQTTSHYRDHEVRIPAKTVNNQLIHNLEF